LFFLSADGTLVLNTAFLQLTMRDDFDYQQVHHDLAKPAFKKKKRISQPVWPFHQDMASTGDVLTLKGVSLGEVGALTLAGEFTRGVRRLNSTTTYFLHIILKTI
jgi:hypothetical protein